jgi:hypothetical protein
LTKTSTISAAVRACIHRRISLSSVRRDRATHRHQRSDAHQRQRPRIKLHRLRVGRLVHTTCVVDGQTPQAFRVIQRRLTPSGTMAPEQAALIVDVPVIARIQRVVVRSHTQSTAHDLEVRVVHAITGELIRKLTIDPTKNYQPLGIPPGPKPRRPPR